MSTHRCDRHRPGDYNCCTHCGCSCFPCRLAKADYMRSWRAGETASTNADVVAQQLLDLNRAGWTWTAIAAEAGVTRKTLRLIRDGCRDLVRPRVAAAIADVHRSLDDGPAVIVAAPLVEALKTRLSFRLSSTMTDADLAAYHRAARTGHITEPMADRLSVRYLGHPPELVYGCDLAEVAA